VGAEKELKEIKDRHPEKAEEANRSGGEVLRVRNHMAKVGKARPG
jgi:hypothetical protein